MGLRSDYPKRIGPTPVNSTDTLLYTVSQRALMTDIHFTNCYSSAVLASLGSVPVAGSEVVTNRAVDERAVCPNGIYQFTQQSVPLEAREKLVAVSDGGNEIKTTIAVTDREDGAR